MEPSKVEPKKHSKFSASGAYRWLACPASIIHNENAPPQKDSAYAAEGTRAHECLEILLKGTRDPKSALDLIRDRYPLDMRDHAIGAVAWILAQHGKALAGSALLCETKVDLSFIEPGMFGTVDAAIVEEFGRLTVIDFKYGQGIVVDPKDNSQLIYYALGLAHQYDYNFKDVELVIIQPRAEHEGGTTRSHVMPMGELLLWTQRFAEGVKRAKDPLAEFHAGDHCRFCPGAIGCPEISTRAMRSAQIEFDEVKEITTTVSPAMMTPVQLSKCLVLAEHLDLWLKELREYAYREADRGTKIPGFKLVEKRGIRKWKDPVHATTSARSRFGPWAFTKPELVSPAQFEKIFAASSPEAREFIENYAAQMSSGTTLAPESDRRPAVAPTVEIDFDQPLVVNPKAFQDIKNISHDEIVRPIPGKEDPMTKAKKKTVKKKSKK